MRVESVASWKTLRMRVMGAEGQCISLERSRLPFNDDLAALSLEGLVGGSLNRTLIEQGMVPYRGEQWAEVVGLARAFSAQSCERVYAGFPAMRPGEPA